MAEESYSDVFLLLSVHGVADDKARAIVGHLRKDGRVLVKAQWRDRMRRLESAIEEIAKGVVTDG